MPGISIAEFFLHLAAFLVVFAPVSVLSVIYRNSRGDFAKALVGLTLGFIPMALYHLFEALRYFDLNLLPPEGSTANIMVGHFVQVISFLAFTAFLLWFNRVFVAPFYVRQRRRG